MKSALLPYLSKAVNISNPIRAITLDLKELLDAQDNHKLVKIKLIPPDKAVLKPKKS